MAENVAATTASPPPGLLAQVLDGLGVPDLHTLGAHVLADAVLNHVNGSQAETSNAPTSGIPATSAGASAPAPVDSTQGTDSIGSYLSATQGTANAPQDVLGQSQAGATPQAPSGPPATTDIQSAWKAGQGGAPATEGPQGMPTLDDVLKHVNAANQYQQQAAKMVAPTPPTGVMPMGKALISALAAGLVQKLSGKWSNAGQTVLQGAEQGNLAGQTKQYQQLTAEQQAAQRQLAVQAQGEMAQAEQMAGRMSAGMKAAYDVMLQRVKNEPWTGGYHAQVAQIVGDARTAYSHIMANGRLSDAIINQLKNMAPDARAAMLSTPINGQPPLVDSSTPEGQATLKLLTLAGPEDIDALAKDKLSAARAGYYNTIAPSVANKNNAAAAQSTAHAGYLDALTKAYPSLSASQIQKNIATAQAAITNAASGTMNAGTNRMNAISKDDLNQFTETQKALAAAQAASQANIEGLKKAMGQTTDPKKLAEYQQAITLEARNMDQNAANSKLMDMAKRSAYANPQIQLEMQNARSWIAKGKDPVAIQKIFEQKTGLPWPTGT